MNVRCRSLLNHDACGGNGFGDDQLDTEGIPI